jgi:hypothetical protein
MFSDNNCEDYDSFIALTTGRCINTGGGFDISASCVGQNHWDIFYHGNECTDLLVQSPLMDSPTTCYATDDDDADADDNYDDDGGRAPIGMLNPPPSISTTPFPPTKPDHKNSELSYCLAAAPSAEPTAAPSRMPSTAYPTNKASADVSFEMGQVHLSLSMLLCLYFYFSSYGSISRSKL